MRTVALLIALLAFWFAYDSIVLDTDPFGSDDRSFEDRERAARHAVTLTVPGARAFNWRSGGQASTHEFHADRSRSGRKISYAFRLLRRFDWSGVAFPDDADGGPLVTLMAQADLHRSALADAGFELVNSWAFAGDDRFDGMPPRVDLPNVITRPSIHVSHGSRSEGTGHAGQSHGGYLLDLDAPAFVHHRVYFHRGSGATLFTRIEYDQANRDVLVEFTYSDRTILGVAYGDTTYHHDEWIDKPGD